MTIDVVIPEVSALHQKPRFYREGEKEMVEIQFVGEKDTVIRKVTPEIMARFPAEWTAHCDGLPPKKRTGTALTEVPGITDQIAEIYLNMNVHTAEELAALHDGQCQSLGHGTLTRRKAAQDMLGVRRMKQQEEIVKRISQASKSVSALPETDERYASKDDLNEVKNMLAQLIEMQKPKKPGRPKKDS